MYYFPIHHEPSKEFFGILRVTVLEVKENILAEVTPGSG